MNKVEAGRGLTLAWYLRTEVLPRKFCMDWWGDVLSSRRHHSEAIGSLEELEEQHPCCTSGCAMGYATNIWPNTFRLHLPQIGDAELYYRAREGWRTCQRKDIWQFFGLTAAETYYLFYGPNTTPKRKAAQMEQVVRSYGYDYADADQLPKSKSLARSC